jgi:two-component system response regulator HydG
MGDNYTPSNHSPYLFERSATLERISDQIDEVAPTSSGVIIYGESGTGKEIIAREIHKRSRRRKKSFVTVDCAALSKDKAGSELFGHERGPVSGAVHQKTGNFELAHGGTIFLDEIANLSQDIQLAMLRTVEERRMRRIGGVKEIELDVRIIIANNEKLPDAVGKGKFREDLLHHFNEFTIDVPPLRERKEDIMMLANYFLELLNEELGKNIMGFSEEVEEIFTNYIWYGNLRELKNVIKRAMLLTDGQYIEDRSLPFEISNFNKLLFENAGLEHSMVPEAPSSIVTSSIPRTLLHENTLKEVSIDAEYEMILEALKQSNFNKSKAARYLNIDRKTLYNKMKQYQQLNNH